VAEQALATLGRPRIGRGEAAKLATASYLARIIYEHIGSKHKYTLTFARDQYAPVSAFWSVSQGLNTGPAVA
jgi:hypothetical protein